MKDMLFHSAPSHPLFFEIFLRSILIYPLPCTSPTPPRIPKVCLKIRCIYTCPSATHSLREIRDYRWPSLS